MNIKNIGLLELTNDEKKSINGGFVAMFAAGFVIGWMIAHHDCECG